MLRNQKLGVSWPPCGWDDFASIQNLTAQAVMKDSASSTITSMYYKIDPIPICNKDNSSGYIYHLSIDGWKYSVSDKSREYNVLSFNFSERSNKFLSKDYSISDIKINSRPFLLNKRSAQRAYTAALFMIKQIESGQVPDYKRILRLHKIHPTQRSLYELDNCCEDAQKWGLMPSCINMNNISEKA